MKRQPKSQLRISATRAMNGAKNCILHISIEKIVESRETNCIRHKESFGRTSEAVKTGWKLEMCGKVCLRVFCVRETLTKGTFFSCVIRLQEMSAGIAAIFAECQRHCAVHKSSIKKLSAVLKEEGSEKLSECLEFMLRGVVDQYLLVSKKEPAVERVVKFFCEFLAQSASFETDTVFMAGMEHLLQRSMAADKNVRYRACQSIAFVIANINGDALISDALWEGLVQTLTPRLRDKAPNVRMWAVKALHRLQNGEKAEDPLFTEFMRLMESDSAAAVRVSAVDNVLVCKASLAALVERVRDVKPEVRIAALERLTSTVDVRHLSSSQRATIVTFGLADRDVSCRHVAIGLVQKWATTLDNRVPKLLQLLGMASNKAAVETVAHTLVDIVENAGNNPFPASAGLKAAVRDDIPRWESEHGVSGIPGSEILWAQLRCDYAIKNFAPAAAEAVISHLVPDTVFLCKLLSTAHSCVDLSSKESLRLSVHNLLRMTSFMDAADVSGGQELRAVCEQMLIDVHFPEELVCPVLDAWLRGLGRVNQKTILTSITDLSEKFGNMGESDGDNDGDSAAFDEDTLEVLAATRGLQLVSWALEQGLSGGGKNNSQLCETFYHFAIDSLQSTSPDMRRLAVQCLGLMGLSSEELCAANREILVQVAAQDLEELDVRDQALRAIADLAAVHPVLFSEDIMLSNLLLRVLRDHENLFTTASLRLNAAEAAAKLLFAGTLTDSKLFATLLQVFFVPDLLSCSDMSEGSTAEAEQGAIDVAVVRLQQLLSCFFHSFAAPVAGKVSGIRASLMLASIPDLFSSMVGLCRDGLTPASTVGKMASHVLTMCGDVIAAQASIKSSGSETSQTLHELQAAVAASISREVLKLGNSKAEKGLVKDLVKILGTLTPQQWDKAHLARNALKCSKCIARNVTLDVTTTKLLTIFMNACSKTAKAGDTRAAAAAATAAADGTEEDEPLCDSEAYALYEAKQVAEAEKNRFFEFAPGLYDLVEMIAVEDSDIDSAAEDGEEEDGKDEGEGGFAAEQAVVEAAVPVSAPAPKKKAVIPKKAAAKPTRASRAKKAPAAATATATTEEEDYEEAGATVAAAPARASSRRTRATPKAAAMDAADLVDEENANPQAI